MPFEAKDSPTALSQRSEIKPPDQDYFHDTAEDTVATKDDCKQLRRPWL
jgi:hypothetical protein